MFQTEIHRLFHKIWLALFVGVLIGALAPVSLLQANATASPSAQSTNRISAPAAIATTPQRAAAMTQKATLLMESEKNLSVAVIDPAGGFAYFGTDTSPGMVVKVRLSDFTRVDALMFEAGEDKLTSAVIDTAEGYAYFGTKTSPGKVVKVRLSDFTRVDDLTLDAGENMLTSAVIDPDNRVAYFGTDTTPGPRGEGESGDL
jgi:hypothetical protein